jgi:arylsulfatase A-like enzyme
MLNQIKNEGRRAYLKKYLGKSPNLDYVLAKYYGAIAYVDHEVGRLMNALKKNHLLENTLIVITSDHGESLTEHDIFFDHHGLYDVSIHVPLILAGPKLPEGRRIKGLIQHVDLAPTILEILDLPVQNEKAFDGNSLTPLINGDKKELHPAVFAEEAYYERKRAVRTKRYKYIKALSKEEGLCRCCHLIHGALEELYDLSLDPQEVQNIVEKEPKVRNELRNRLSKWVESFEENEANGRKEEKTMPQYEKEVEVMERLRKLGYF